MIQHKWGEFYDTLRALPDPTKKDLIEKLVWIVEGFPIIYRDAETRRFVIAVQALNEALNDKG